MLFSYDTLRKLIFTEYHINVIVAMVGGHEQLRKMVCTLFFFQRGFGNLGTFLASSWSIFCYCKIGLSAVEKDNILESIFHTSPYSISIPQDSLILVWIYGLDSHYSQTVAESRYFRGRLKLRTSGIQARTFTVDVLKLNANKASFFLNPLSTRWTKRLSNQLHGKSSSLAS